MHFKAVQLLTISVSICVLIACEKPKEAKDDHTIRRMTDEAAATQAKAIESSVNPTVASGLTLSIWGVDSLVADPVSIDIDDDGKIYYTRTNRQKNSEFDIRAHQDWEIESIALQTVEDKRAFLHRVLSPENSKKNSWLKDLNGDSLHDWRDMTVEKETVYRLEDQSGDGRADLSQKIIEDFHDETTDAMGGILKHGKDLFVDLGPDLWRLRDTDNNGTMDEKTSLSHGYGIHVGFGGHGMSGVELGPEGKIYWQIGDIGFNGKGPDGQKWEHPNSGVVVRANPDGSDFEVFAYGNRNTHEFAFDEYGNLISEDNDGDHAGESERLVYIVNGADLGWRTNWQFGKYRDPKNNTYKVWMDEKMAIPRFEGQAAYFLPTIRNFVNGPTGFLYNPGTALGPEWYKTFFVVEFVGNPSRSGLHSFRLTPKGASFDFLDTKQMISGVLATGIDFGPDGAMYLGDWVEGWNTKDYGRIWKLDVSTALTAERKQTKTDLSADVTPLTPEQLETMLKSPDMRVRQKSQLELATRGDEGLKVFKRAIAQRENQLARVNAIWGVSQLARKDIKRAAVLAPLLTDQDPEIRAQAAKWIGDVRYKDASAQLLPLLNDEYARARFFAAEALGRIAYEPATQSLIDLLSSNNDEDNYIRHAASLALARIGNKDAIGKLSSHPSRAVRIGAVLALRRMGAPEVAAFLTDKDEFIATEAARAINDDLSIKDALPALGDLLATTPFNNEALLRRSINANLRVGNEKAMQNLIAFAALKSRPAAMRTEAVAALSTWATPSVLDRVDGRYRGEVIRDADAVKKNSAAALMALTSDNDWSVRFGAVKALGKLGVSQSSGVLMEKLAKDPRPEVRAEAMRSLGMIADAPVSEALKIAMADRDKSVRVVGLDLLPRMKVSHDLMIRLLTDAINTRTTEERQTAITVLGSLPAEEAQPTLQTLVAKMKSKQLSPELYLELGEALDSIHSNDLKIEFEKAMTALGKDSTQSKYLGSLNGGDPQIGESIFYNNQSAQCIRCHTYGDYGGTAGPRLNGVASRLTREQLLEAVITPSARLAPGFGTVSVELKNGKTIQGILQLEKSDRVVVKTGDKPDTTIMMTSIAKKVNGASSMPPMGSRLSKKEIRDVVAFLATLK